MSASIRKLGLNGLQLGLILLLHLGVLSLAFGPNWIRVMYSQHNRAHVLLSLLILSAAYIAAFRFGRALHEKEKLRAVLLYAAATASFSLLLYGVFLSGERTAQITASTFLFLVIIAIAAFCESGKAKAWKNLHRALRVSLLLAAPAIFYPYPGLIFQSETRGIEEKSIIRTAFYDVELSSYRPSHYVPGRFPEPVTHIGAFDDKTFLAMTHYGDSYLLSLRNNTDNGTEEEFYVKRLASRLYPTTGMGFLYPRLSEKKVKPSFRVNDLLIDTENGQKRLYVSHHFWNAERECITLRITKLVGEVSVLLENDAVPEWRTLYETTPCMPLGKPGSLFPSHHGGGRIIGLDENTLLFSVGDHQFDTFNAPQGFPQELDSSYGKILKIDRDTGAAEPFSIGHRNPQGLYLASDGAIWETEHGPRGGDELNRIEPGKNYGWPLVSYGTQYGKFTWPPGVGQNTHEGYEHPVFAWTPSIGVSNLIRVEKDLFPLWKHSLLVGSLVRQTLFRLQMRGNRVIYSEPIHIGRRVRDITETPNGEIFIWADRRRSLLRLRPVNAQAVKSETNDAVSKRLFRHKYARPVPPRGMGANLHGVYSGPIAGAGDFHYSPALQSGSQQRWTRESLDLFPGDPDAFAPGTATQMKAPDDHEREVLTRYQEKIDSPSEKSASQRRWLPHHHRLTPSQRG